MKIPKLAPRQWVYFAITWVLFVVSIVGLFLFSAVADDSNGGSTNFWIGLVVVLVGPPILVAITSLSLFGAFRRIKNAFALAGCAFGVMFFAVFSIAVRPAGMLHGARSIMLGSAAGSPSEIAATDAAWVDVSPAFVDTTRIGRATHTSTDNEGRSSTRGRAVAPILTAHGEADPALLAAEQVALFVCLDDREDVIEASRGNGTISGRMHRPDWLELQAITDARIEDRTAEPRCVVPGRGASVFWIVLWILVVLVGGTGGAAIVTAVAAPRR
jgi:hypothetical protein